MYNLVISLDRNHPHKRFKVPLAIIFYISCVWLKLNKVNGYYRMEAVSEEPQQNTVEGGASSGPDSPQGSPPKDQNQNKPSKSSSSPPPAASTGTSKGGLILDTNIKRDDPSAAKRTLSSRLSFRPDHALKFLKKKKRDDKIDEILEGL